MRLWSLHPAQLDRTGLVACWREALLAQAVIAGRTRGYTRHPQLERFREAERPLEAIGRYLTGLAAEADARGYRFDRSRITNLGEPNGELAVSVGQLEWEWAHLLAKLAVRSPEDARRWGESEPALHPLFRLEPGPVATWERGYSSPTLMGPTLSM